MKSIVIDREYGSGGREVAKILAERLGIAFYDGELLVLAGQQQGVNISQLQDLDEKNVGSMLYNIALAASSIQDSSRLSVPYQAFAAVAEVIKKIDAKGPAIFMGRCADQVLAEAGRDCLHVFVYASELDDRIRRAEEVGASGNVLRYIQKKDEQRRNYDKFYAEREWGRKENYDLCLNTSKLSYEQAAGVIAAAAE